MSNRGTDHGANGARPSHHPQATPLAETRPAPLAFGGSASNAAMRLASPTTAPARVLGSQSEANVRPARRPGCGNITVERVADRSTVTRLRSESPLRLLTPRSAPGDAAWVFSSTFGGGLLGGDHIDLSIDVSAGAALLLGTQASTKVYRCVGEASASQSIQLRVDTDATAAMLPDPLTCFAEAAYEQRTRIDLSDTASIVSLDWLTSGRRARGERWAFRHYTSRTEVTRAGRCIYRDALSLDEFDGPLAGEHRMGRCDCYAVMLLLGPRVEADASALLAWANRQPVRTGEALIFAASPIAGGAVVRVAGPTTETVGRWLRERLAFIPELLGGDPWARKM